MYVVGSSKSGIMTKTEIRKNLIGIVSVALSFALGFTAYNAFKTADLADLRKKPQQPQPAKPAPPAPPTPQAKNLSGDRMRVRKSRMKEFSGHGQAVSDNVANNEKVSSNKQMIQSAPSSEMLS